MKEGLSRQHDRAIAPEGGRQDLVFDFAGSITPDLSALCLVLTATILADADHRKVWLHGLPEPAWRILTALGLRSFFSLMPQIGGSAH